MDEAEQLHKESLHVLAKLVHSSGNKTTELHKEVLNEFNPNIKRSKKELAINRNLGSTLLNKDKENKFPLRLSRSTMTPQKESSVVEPSTPTANLKMLVCAASILPPASDFAAEPNEQAKHVSLDTARENLFCIQTSKLKIKKNVLVGRKEKSLGLLCEKFMSFYPEYSENGTTILLDDVVKILGIGRRRVYDIVNVLESMEMMVRQAKNKYLWFGKSRLNATLSKLKTLAFHVYGRDFHCNNYQKEMFAKAYEKNSERSHVQILPKPFVKLKDNSNNSKNDENIEVDKEKDIKSANMEDFSNFIMDDTMLNDMKSSRSLGILCQKFIMLFMVSEDSVVTLDKAAKLLLTEPDEGPSKYKTKVRRLYDIANILISIKFLEKCTSHEDPSKKAAYRWVGFDLDTLNCKETSTKAFIDQEFSLTRHSLLAQGPRKANDKKKLHCRSLSAHQLLTPGSNTKRSATTPTVFPRALSATSIKKQKEDTEDGFDVYKIEQGDSPRQVLFKEKLRELQKEFPTKLPGNGLLELLSACRSDGSKRTLRRSLSSEFAADKSTPEKKLKIDDSENIKVSGVNLESKSGNGIQVQRFSSSSAAVPVIYPVLVPSHHQNFSENLLHDVSQTMLRPTEKNSSPELASTTCPKQSIAVTVKKPVLASTIASNNMSYYQVVPIRYNQYSNKMQQHLVQLPIVLQQKPGCLPLVVKKAPAVPSHNINSISRVLMQPPVSMRNAKFQGRSVISVSTKIPQCISPKVSLTGSTYEGVNKHLKNYPELCTPPQVIKNDPDGKPIATPILFPKMTPETPSAENLVPHAALNTVTRKLMSLHSDR